MEDKMSEVIKKKSKDPKKRKENSGQFKKGNIIGMETRFKPLNTDASVYKDEYCEALCEYFQPKEAEILYEDEYYKDGSVKSHKPKVTLPPKYPTFEGFAASIGIARRTLYEWVEAKDADGNPKYPRFSQAYAYAKQMQLSICKENAMAKVYDSNFAKFVLINEHGMKEQQEVTTNVSGNISTAIDERTLKLIERVEKRLNGDGKQD
jgi:hypothetical protein